MIVDILLEGIVLMGLFVVGGSLVIISISVFAIRRKK